jgi:hypothetical protein
MARLELRTLAEHTRYGMVGAAHELIDSVRLAPAIESD